MKRISLRLSDREPGEAASLYMRRRRRCIHQRRRNCSGMGLRPDRPVETTVATARLPPLGADRPGGKEKVIAGEDKSSAVYSGIIVHGGRSGTRGCLPWALECVKRWMLGTGDIGNPAIVSSDDSNDRYIIFRIKLNKPDLAARQAFRIRKGPLVDIELCRKVDRERIPPLPRNR